MKRAMLGGLAISALLSAVPLIAANAADMALKAPPPPPPVPIWTGFYGGADIGALFTRDKLSESTAFVPPATGNATTYGTSVIGGGYAGYNWQIGQFVLGPEVDFEGTSLNRSSNCLVQDAGAGNAAPGTCFAPSYSFGMRIPWEASARVRLGYAWTNTLFYVTGGAAFAQINTSYSTIAGYAPLGSQSFNQTRAGGTIGAGLEYMFGGHWVGRVEYRYANFGTVSNAISVGGGFWNGYTDNRRLDENVVRVGVSYLFNGPGVRPLVANY